MPLAAHTPEKRTLKFKRLEFTVRGLNTDDVTGILSRRLADVHDAAELITKAKAGTLTQTAVDAFIIQLCMKFPWLVAEVISVASDEPDTIEQARALALPVQITAITEIFAITFEEAGGLKNWFAAQVAMAREHLPPELLNALTPRAVTEAVQAALH